jgi:NitT/TauT family transport system permease protein/taurine transport system permease protein
MSKTIVEWRPVAAEAEQSDGGPWTARLAVLARDALRGPFAIVISFVLALAVWQALSTWVINPYMIPPPTVVFETAIPMFASGEILGSVGISLVRVLVGFFLGSAVGIVLGILMGRLEMVNRLLDPIIELMRYLSPTAMIPIAVIWFGIGETSKYFLIFWGCFVFVLINTAAGVVRVPVGRERAARCLGASGLGIVLKVVLPSALPDIITGMRLAMATSLMAIVPAEMLAADSGLGYLLQTSGMLAQTNRIFVALVTISVLGFILDFVFRLIVRKTLGRYMMV